MKWEKDNKQSKVRMWYPIKINFAATCLASVKTGNRRLKMWSCVSLGGGKRRKNIENRIKNWHVVKYLLRYPNISTVSIRYCSVSLASMPFTKIFKCKWKIVLSWAYQRIASKTTFFFLELTMKCVTENFKFHSRCGLFALQHQILRLFLFLPFLSLSLAFFFCCCVWQWWDSCSIWNWQIGDPYVIMEYNPINLSVFHCILCSFRSTSRSQKWFVFGWKQKQKCCDCHTDWNWFASKRNRKLQ